jgi:hypothetical protein
MPFKITAKTPDEQFGKFTSAKPFRSEEPAPPPEESKPEVKRKKPLKIKAPEVKPQPVAKAGKFQLPSDLPTVSRHTGNPFSSTTLNTYKTRLNKLAAGGISSVDELIANQDKAIEISKADTSSDPAKMRVYLSAMFWVLTNTPQSNKQKLYSEFNSYKSEVYPQG